MTMLERLRARLEEVRAKAQALLAAADTRNALFTDEEQTEYDGHLEEVRTLQARIAAEVESQRTLSTQAAPSAQAAEGDLSAEERATLAAARGGLEDGAEPAGNLRAKITLDEHEHGFAHMGEWMQAVRKAHDPGAPTVDRRLIALNMNGGLFGQELRSLRAEGRAPTGASTIVPSDGGFLVQKDFNDTMLERTFTGSEILSRVTKQPIGANANGFKQPRLVGDSRADGVRHGGLRAYWLNEGDPLTASKAKVTMDETALQKIAGLYYSTDELEQDAVAMGAYVARTMPEELRFQVEQAIVTGSGVGKPLGHRTAGGAHLTIAKETSQAAASFDAQNFAKMWARMWTRSLGNAVWTFNQDCWPALLAVNDAANGKLFLPGGLLKDAPYGAMYGRPMLPLEYNPTVGSADDVQFVDYSQYVLIDKGAINNQSSMHVRFLWDEMVYRWIWRVGGKPMWNAPLTPYQGTATQSTSIGLAARA